MAMVISAQRKLLVLLLVLVVFIIGIAAATLARWLAKDDEDKGRIFPAERLQQLKGVGNEVYCF